MLLGVLFIVGFASGLSVLRGNGSDIQPPLVQTPQRLLRGKFLTTYTGTTFHTFRRVRFAEPPTGENRFKLKLLNTIYF